MPSRRSFLFLPLLHRCFRPPSARSFCVGDLVRVAAIPARSPLRNTDFLRHLENLDLCLGKTCRVIFVGEDGRPELDVVEHVRHSNPSLAGCSISFEPNCLEPA